MTPHEIAAKLKIGMTRRQVREVLGEPEAEGIGSRKYPRPCVWKYGEVECHFHYPEDGGLWLAFYHDEDLNHITLLKETPMSVDFERGAKVTGSKFYFLTGEDALREWKLIHWMIDYHRKNGYQFVQPPFLINKKTGEQAGILPRFAGDFYETTDGFMLIPTAETPLVGLHSDEVFREQDLPIKYVAYSPCFRKEAGAPGARDKGYKRVHQFNKVELFVICTPDQSERLHAEMIEQVTAMIGQLGINFRTVELTPDDRSPVSNKTIDVELEVGDEWLEVSSISNTGENQSKPAQIRYKPKAGGKNVKCHLLNGSGVALPRLMLALNGRELPI